MKKIVLLFVLGLTLSLQADAAKVPFIEGSIYKAKQIAGTEGKLYFVDFYANWCMPCRLMDETTFQNDAVINYVNKNYVPVKVDVDDFDGFAYKQQYNIKVLPTTLVFNSKGELVDRVEKSLSATQMLDLLKKHNLPANRKVTITAPPKPVIVDKPAAKPTPAAPAKPKVTAKAKPAGTGLFRFNVERESPEGFSVQVGVYADYANVLTQTSTFSKKYGSKPILVHITTLGDKMVYRVLVGRFSKLSSAESFLTALKADGQEGVIKTLADLE